jgi:beta-galactosidase
VRVRYGGDYNPEQWPEEVWQQDVALMREAGVNLVSVGIFAWSRLEPVQGRYTFDWLDRVLDLLAAGGVRVALATPTASPPPWFGLAHPDALPVTRDGNRLTHGSRDTYCVSAPAYRDACVRIARELATRYAGHPALAMWHVHNEYGTWCHCDHVATAFQSWLTARYGSLERLNDAWTTSFWSQCYSSWEQILPPRATQYLGNPTQLLDFRRFLSDELLVAFGEQKAVLRELTPDTPVTTNFVFGGWVPVDHRRWAGAVDLVAIDHYPSSAGEEANEQTAFAADLARSWAGGRPWLLMESAPNLIYTDGRMHTRQAGQMARHSMSHVARGSSGAMFFQWRAPRGGAELYHSAMVPHAGPDSRVFRESVALGRLLSRLSEVDDGRVCADVAIAWDAEAWWALEAAHTPSDRLSYLDPLRQAHRVLWRAGTTVDFVAPEADLSAYKMVLVPSLYLVSDAAAESIGRYVAGGGRLVVSFFSGIVDADAQVRLGGYPGAFRDVLGVRVEEFHPLPDDISVRLSTGDTGQLWSEHVWLTGAVSVADYVGGHLDGLPAITRHGTAWYVSTQLDDAGYARLIEGVASQAGVNPVVAGLPPGVEVVRRVGEAASWLFVINHTASPCDVPAHGVDLVTGAAVDDSLTVPPGALAVIRSGAGGGLRS